jgi:hypothetical protein
LCFQANGVNVSVLDVVIEHTGTYGAWLAGGSNNTLKRLRLRDLGAGGIRVGEGGNSTTNPTKYRCLCVFTSAGCF